MQSCLNTKWSVDTPIILPVHPFSHEVTSYIVPLQHSSQHLHTMGWMVAYQSDPYACHRPHAEFVQLQTATPTSAAIAVDPMRRTWE